MRFFSAMHAPNYRRSIARFTMTEHEQSSGNQSVFLVRIEINLTEKLNRLTLNRTLFKLLLTLFCQRRRASGAAEQYDPVFFHISSALFNSTFIKLLIDNLTERKP
jgi:hypothetical protein